MKTARLLLVFPCLFLPAFAGAATGTDDSPLSYVNPFIGVDHDGMELPGPCLPFSEARPGPDCPIPNWTTGYRSTKPIDGFSQNHISGTGGPGRFGNFLVVPEADAVVTSGYSSDKAEESARPGYYSVFLKRWRVRAELTTTERCTFHRYTFAPGVTPHILIDASRLVYPNWKDVNDPHVIGCQLTVPDDSTIEGTGEFAGGWGHPHSYKFYIVARFDRPFVRCGVWSDGRIAEGQRQIAGEKVGAYAAFAPSPAGEVRIKIGISYQSLANARKHLEQIPGWDFPATAARAERIWREQLSKIRVAGGTRDQRTLFYTSLYRCFTMPTEVTGDDPKWDSPAPHFWDYYCIWDTFRTLHPLLTLIAPDRQVAMLQSLLDIYDHRGWMPDAWIVGEAAYIQGGTNTDVLFADALLKGLEGIDYEKAYRAMIKNATVMPDRPEFYGRHLDEYNRLGYCSSKTFCGSSRTLEYAYDDFCIAEVAQALGRTDDRERFRRQSLRCYNLFDDRTKFFWAKDEVGRWVDGFSPVFMKAKPYEGPYFYEGTPWHYSTYVPHDVRGLVKRHGGDQAFVAFLDAMFDQGEYTHTNQPDILTPYLYNYAGRPDRTAERVRHLLATAYRPTVDGWPGNDDAGCLSSWYVFSALGFYPNAGQDLYLIGSPVFERAEIDLGKGRTFVVVARNASEQNRYVQSATLNGRKLDRPWFTHTEIKHGGELDLIMGPEPSDWGRKNPPPSLSDGAPH